MNNIHKHQGFMHLLSHDRYLLASLLIYVHTTPQIHNC